MMRSLDKYWHVG
ncbi:hypothetical protein D030_0280A, partial [Vibrio parahaemolyticus AQ3810]